MSYAVLRVAIPILEDLLHLTEHGIQIVHARAETADTVIFHLTGDGLPDGPVRAIFLRTPEGRDVLHDLEPEA